MSITSTATSSYLLNLLKAQQTAATSAVSTDSSSTDSSSSATASKASFGPSYVLDISSQAQSFLSGSASAATPAQPAQTASADQSAGAVHHGHHHHHSAGEATAANNPAPTSTDTSADGGDNESVASALEDLVNKSA